MFTNDATYRRKGKLFILTVLHKHNSDSDSDLVQSRLYLEYFAPGESAGPSLNCSRLSTALM